MTTARFEMTGPIRSTTLRRHRGLSQTDFTADLKKITVPTLVMHGDDDQIVPYADAGRLSAKLVKSATLKTYKVFPHGLHHARRDDQPGSSRVQSGMTLARAAHALGCSWLAPTRLASRSPASPIRGGLQTNAICYGPFTEGAAKRMETE